MTRGDVAALILAAVVFAVLGWFIAYGLTGY